jgi:hypothetical protein
MNDKVQTTQSVYTDEQVEILDNDDHLGWADVVDGNWTFSPPLLSVGTHKLTAAFRGTTSAVWNVEVTGPVIHIDDLESAPLGNITEPLVRPFYTLTSAPVGSWEITPVRVLTYNQPPGIQGKMLYLMCAASESYPHEVAMGMTFNQPYLIVSFWCWVHDFSAAGVMKVDAFDDEERLVRTFDFKILPHEHLYEVVLAAPPRVTIKSLHFHQTASSSPTSAVALSLDNFKFER